MMLFKQSWGFSALVIVGSLAMTSVAWSSHPTTHLPISDVCYKASVHWANNQFFSRESGIPNPPTDLTPEALKRASESTCTVYLDGALAGARVALGRNVFPQLCQMLRTEGLHVYGAMFIQDGFSADFGRRQAQNLAISCDHALIR